MWGVTLKTTETLRLRLPDALRRHHTIHNHLCLIGKSIEGAKMPMDRAFQLFQFQFDLCVSVVFQTSYIYYLTN